MAARMTELFADPDRAARWCAQQRQDGRTLGFVPTMGALHAGHLSLVERAVAENDRAIVSVFVNPLQFDDSADFAAYPRELGVDAGLLATVDCHALFSGTLEQFFPGRCASPTTLVEEAYIDPGPSSAGLEGAYRESHFRGVATIVDRLFELVRCDRAYFGAKDFQQTLVVSDLARRRGGPTVVVCATQREPDGLALSSRNVLLTPEHRERAPGIHASLCAARERWRAGERGPQALGAVVRAGVEALGFAVDYAEVRDPHAWTPEAPAGPLERAVALVAARAGDVRLIDNLRLDDGDRR